MFLRVKEEWGGRLRGAGSVERKGKERLGEKTQLCQWTECTIKTGVTTKVRAALTVNTESRVESGKGELW